MKKKGKKLKNNVGYMSNLKKKRKLTSIMRKEKEKSFSMGGSHMSIFVFIFLKYNYDEF